MQKPFIISKIITDVHLHHFVRLIFWESEFWNCIPCSPFPQLVWNSGTGKRFLSPTLRGSLDTNAPLACVTFLRTFFPTLHPAELVCKNLAGLEYQTWHPQSSHQLLAAVLSVQYSKGWSTQAPQGWLRFEFIKSLWEVDDGFCLGGAGGCSRRIGTAGRSSCAGCALRAAGGWWWRGWWGAALPGPVHGRDNRPRCKGRGNSSGVLRAGRGVQSWRNLRACKRFYFSIYLFIYFIFC